MSKSVCYIKRDNDKLSINAIYKGDDQLNPKHKK